MVGPRVRALDSLSMLCFVSPSGSTPSAESTAYCSLFGIIPVTRQNSFLKRSIL